MLDLTPVFQAVITLAATVIPYIKSKTTTEQRTQLQAWARIGVSAAEQVYQGEGRGEIKKKYVLDFLANKGYTVDLTTLSALIEAEVNSLWQDKLIIAQEE